MSKPEFSLTFRLGVLMMTLLISLFIGVAGWFLWKEFDPYVLDRPSAKRSAALRDVARARSLNDAEFAEVVALLKNDLANTQLSSIAVISLEAERNPIRRAEAIVALKECGQTASPDVAKSAQQAAQRIEALPK